MSVKKVTWLGIGTLRPLAIPTGRTKTIQSALLTGAVMRLHGAYLVVQDARTGLVEFQGNLITEAAVRTLKGFRGYAPGAARPVLTNLPEPEHVRRPVVTRPQHGVLEPAPVLEHGPSVASETEPVLEPVLELDPVVTAIEAAPTRKLRELAGINGLPTTGGARVLRAALLEKHVVDGVILEVTGILNVPTPASLDVFEDLI